MRKSQGKQPDPDESSFGLGLGQILEGQAPQHRLSRRLGAENRISFLISGTILVPVILFFCIFVVTPLSMNQADAIVLG